MTKKRIEIASSENFNHLECENKLLKKILNGSNIGEWKINLRTHEIIWSKEVYKLFGFKNSSITPSIQLMVQASIPENIEDIRTHYNIIEQAKQPEGSFNQMIMTPEGEYRNLGVHYFIESNNQHVPVFVHGIIQDISQETSFNKQIGINQKRYKSLLDSATDYIFVIGTNGVVEFVNTYAASQIHKSPEDIIGMKLKDVFPKDLYERQIKSIKKVIETGVSVNIDSMSVFGNHEVWLNTNLTPFYNEEGVIDSVLGVSRDITYKVNAEKKIHEREEVYRQLIEQAADGIFICDQEGNFNTVNSYACELSGYTQEELLTMNIKDFFSKAELKKNPLRIDLLINGETVVNERMLTCKNGDKVAVEMNTKRMINGNLQSIMRDVSERKKAEEFLLRYQEELEMLVKHHTFKLEEANTKLKKENTERIHTEELLKIQLKEKEILLKEIHHRVKNNMQVIISLLNLQASTIEDGRMLELYQESQNRIKSMALIHEKLYQSKDLTHIDFSEYLSSLVNYLAQTYFTSKQTVEIFAKSHDVSLEFDTVISLGLIVNELVSNSMKYAFAELVNGKIEVTLKKAKDNNLILSISDNGKGMPSSIDFRNTKSLGLQLVCSLTEQIDGEITMKSDVGTKYQIRFPHK